MKQVIYHHGPVLPAKAAKAIAETFGKLPCRNADHFLPADLEKAERVIVDEGKNTGAIIEAAKAKKAEVIDLADFIAGLKKSKEPKKEEKDEPKDAKKDFEPDADPAKPAPKAQGKAAKKDEPKDK